MTTSVTKLLEETPGVRSIARFVALMLACGVALIVMTCCYIAIYAIVHGRQHEEHAAAAIGSAGAIIMQLGTIMLPVLGGIWIALKLRKLSPDELGGGTTEVTIRGPAGSAPAVSVEPSTSGQ